MIKQDYFTMPSSLRELLSFLLPRQISVSAYQQANISRKLPQP